MLFFLGFPELILKYSVNIAKYDVISKHIQDISRDEVDTPLTQYITSTGISPTRYTITDFNINTTFVFYG